MSDAKPFSKVGAALGKIGAGALKGLANGGPGGALVGAVLGGVFGDIKDESTLATAIEKATPEQVAKILEVNQQVELAQIEAQNTVERELTARQSNDMLSDSVLSKNIRPALCLALNVSAILVTMTIVVGILLYVFSVLLIYWLTGNLIAPELPGGELAEALVTNSLIGLWTAALGTNAFYFGGRTSEKKTAIAGQLESPGIGGLVGGVIRAIKK